MPQRIHPVKIKTDFFGFFIPAIILSMKGLTQNEKLILAYILSITRTKKIFYATNGYLEKNFGMSKATATKSLATLERNKYIVKKSFDGRFRKYYPTVKISLLREQYNYLKNRVIKNSMLT